RQATRPGPAVPGTFSPARARRPAIGPASAQTLGRTTTMSADLTNVEVFNITALKLFAKLYDEFPVPVTIDSKEIGAAASEVAESINDTMKMTFTRSTRSLGLLKKDSFGLRKVVLRTEPSRKFASLSKG